MAAKLDGDEPSAAVMTALTNSVILREIFSQVSFTDLQQCRLVCTTWNLEAGSYMKDFRRCHGDISGPGACRTLRTLNRLLSRKNIVAINSLWINSCPTTSHLRCIRRNEPLVFDQLLKKDFCLKYLDICFDDVREDCPTTGLVVSLLREKATELLRLELYTFPKEFVTLFDEDWVPYFPKLKVLMLRHMEDPKQEEWDLCWASHKDFFLKFINGAPGLEKLEGYFDPEMLQSLPEEKYTLVASFHLFIKTAEQEQVCFKLVEAGTDVSFLSLDAGATAADYMGSLIDFVEQLLNTSWKSLETLLVEKVDIRLTQRKFPALKRLSISMETSVDQLLNTFRSIDYPKALPVLEEVDLTLYSSGYEDPDDEPNHVHNIADPVIELCPSTTVNKMEIDISHRRLSLRAWSEIFPNVSDLTIQTGDDDGIIPYVDLWASWPELEVMRVEDSFSELTAANLDAEFLGIYPEEVTLLRNFDDDALERMNVVPVRPSVLTMSRLKSLTLEIQLGRYVGLMELEPELLFLSKLTGILALRKLATAGVEIEIICPTRRAIRRLSHLVPFVSVTRTTSEYELVHLG